MSVEDFRLANFCNISNRIKDQFTKDSAAHIDLVQKKFEEELKDWEELGRAIGYFPPGSQVQGPVPTVSVSSFQRHLLSALENAEPHDIKAIALIKYAPDPVWRAELDRLKIFYEELKMTEILVQSTDDEYLKVDRNNFLDKAEWISSHYITASREYDDNVIDYPSGWRSLGSEVETARIRELEKMTKKITEAENRSKRQGKSRVNHIAKPSVVIGKVGKDVAHTYGAPTFRSFGSVGPGVGSLRGLYRPTRRAARELIQHLRESSGSVLKPMNADNNVFLAPGIGDASSTQVEVLLKKLKLDGRQVKVVNYTSNKKSAASKQIGAMGEEIVNLGPKNRETFNEVVSHERRKSESKVVIVQVQNARTRATSDGIEFIDSATGEHVTGLETKRGNRVRRGPVIIISDGYSKAQK